MPKQIKERLYEGAKKELKISKNGKPFIHKIFNVRINEKDFTDVHENDLGIERRLNTPHGIAKIRSVFIFNTNRKNTISVMVVLIRPKWNAKGNLIGVMEREYLMVNPKTEKIWKYNRVSKRSTSLEAPFGWTKNEFEKAIFEAVES